MNINFILIKHTNGLENYLRETLGNCSFKNFASELYLGINIEELYWFITVPFPGNSPYVKCIINENNFKYLLDLLLSGVAINDDLLENLE